MLEFIDAVLWAEESTATSLRTAASEWSEVAETAIALKAVYASAGTVSAAKYHERAQKD